MYVEFKSKSILHACIGCFQSDDGNSNDDVTEDKISQKQHIHKLAPFTGDISLNAHSNEIQFDPTELKGLKMRK